MGRARHRKLKVPDVAEGSQQLHNHNQRTVPKSPSDSSSRSSVTPEDLILQFQLMLEQAQSSSRNVNGTLIKQLLAEEMSKETKTRKRSPSVIAKLMGLDGLPSPWPLHRQSKTKGQLTEGRSKSSSLECSEFMDVLEDPEASHMTNQCHSSRWAVNTKLGEPESAFTEQRLRGGKRLSNGEATHGLSEFHDSIDVPDSNKDRMLHQLPSSSFAKHLNDLQDIVTHSLCSHIAVLKPLNSGKSERIAKSWESEGKISSKHNNGSLGKHVDGHSSHTCNSHGASGFLKPDKLEEKDKKDILTTRIVVLKPNLGKNNTLPDPRKHTEYLNGGTGEEISGEMGNSSCDVGHSRPSHREAREMAKEITRRMRESFGGGPFNLSNSAIRGYAGDVSSYNVSESDSANELDIMIPTFKNKLDRSGRQKPSSSGSKESSACREAKKRMSERWRMTHSNQEVGMVNKSSTLGEILAFSDKDIVHANLDAVMGLGGIPYGFASNKRTVALDSPLGISSSDGWKDGSIRNSSRSGLCPPSFGSSSNKTCEQSEAIVDERHLMRKQVMNDGRRQTAKGNSIQKESKNTKFGTKRSQSSKRTSNVSNNSSRGTFASQVQDEIELAGKHPSKEHLMVSQMTAIDASTKSCHSQAALDNEQDMLASSKICTENSSACMSGNDDSPAPQKESSALKGPGLEPESSEGSKKADHPSPVSVLEVEFTEDLSSGSECFEKVSAGLHELRVQLQLLKTESEEYAEASTPIFSDEVFEQGSVLARQEEEIVRAESWESSYLVEVLIEFGAADRKISISTWHSLECPIGHGVFDNLEKKYNDQTWQRSERRLLFDRINKALLEIFERLVNPYPWVKPTTGRIGSKWQRNGLKNEVQKLLACQEKEVIENMEKELDREMQWFSKGEEIDVLGKEVGELLLNHLIAEIVVIMYIF